MAEFNRSEYFPDDFLKAPLDLGKNLLASADAADKLHIKLVQIEKSITAATTLQQVKKSTNELTIAEQELEKIQKQMLVTQAKSTDEVIKAKGELDALNKKLKEKTALGDREAKSVNAQNASYKILEAALVKNKNAYKELTSAEERNSKAGQELLKIIKSQDKELKDLSATMGEHQKKVGQYENALSGLDNLTGGYIGTIKNLGKELLAVAASPFFLAIAAAVGIFKALQAATDYYYTSTLEGEEAAKRSENTWKSFFLLFKQDAIEAGKAASDSGNKFKEFLADMLLRLGVEEGAFGEKADKIVEKRKWLNKQLNLLSDQISRIMQEHIKDVVDDANTELRVNELLEQSKNKLKLTDEERLQALRQAKGLLQEQLKGDLELAKADLRLYESYIKLNGGIIQRGKLITDYSLDEIKALKITGDEVKHLGDLQAELIRIESKAAVQRKALNRQEFQLVQEIEKARVDKIRTREDADRAAYKQQLDDSIKNSQQILQNEILTKDQQIAITESIGIERKEILKEQQKEELLSIRRAAEDRNKEMAQIKAFGELEKNPELTGKELIAIQDKFLNELIGNDVAYLEDRNRITQHYNELLKDETRKTAQEISAIEVAAMNQRIADAQKGYQEFVDQIKKQALAGIITKKEADKQIREMERATTKALLRESIQRLEDSLNNDKILVKEKEKIKEQIDKLTRQLLGEDFNDIVDPKTLEEKLKEIQDVFGEFAFSVGNLFQSLTDRRLQQIDQEDKALTEQHEAYNERLDEQLENFVGTEEDKKAFEKGIKKQKEAEQKEFEKEQQKLEKRRIEEQRKMAIYDKAVSAFQAAIATSLAVIKMLSIGPPGIPLSIAAGIAGAIQVAAILARPIPQFAEGGTAPGGAIIAGELGRELMISPGGKVSFTPDKATLMTNVPAGTEIIPNDETSAILAQLALSGLRISDIRTSGKDNEGIKELVKGIGKLEHTVRTKKEVSINFSKAGAEAAMRHAENRIKFLNNFYR